MAFTNEQMERYSRHIILQEVGVKGQKSFNYRCGWTRCAGSHVSGGSRCRNHRYRRCR